MSPMMKFYGRSGHNQLQILSSVPTSAQEIERSDASELVPDLISFLTSQRIVIYA